MKFQKAGEVDTTFGIDGTVRIALPNDGDAYAANVSRAYQIATSPDGQKIYASCHINEPAGPHATGLFGVWRLNADGSKDVTFGSQDRGSGGYVCGRFVHELDDFLGSDKMRLSLAWDVVFLPEGGLLVCGDSSGAFNHSAQAGIAKFSEDGLADTTFGKEGAWSEAFPEWLAFVRTRVIPQDDGCLLVVGSLTQPGRDSAIGMVRLTSNGMLDTGFHGTGWHVVPFPESGEERGLRDVTKAPGGGIFISGQGVNAGIVLRLNADGSTDTSFGPDGTGFTRVVLHGESEDWPVTLDKILVKPDGSLVVLGAAIVGSITRGLIVGLDAEGNHDVAFNHGEAVLTPYTLAYARYFDGVTDNEGRLIVVGHTKIGMDYRYVLARYLPSGVADTSFGSSGDGLISGDRPEDVYAEPSVTLQGGRILLYANMGRALPSPSVPFEYLVHAFIS